MPNDRVVLLWTCYWCSLLLSFSESELQLFGRSASLEWRVHPVGQGLQRYLRVSWSIPPTSGSAFLCDKRATLVQGCHHHFAHVCLPTCFLISFTLKERGKIGTLPWYHRWTLTCSQLQDHQSMDYFCSTCQWKENAFWLNSNPLKRSEPAGYCSKDFF